MILEYEYLISYTELFSFTLGIKFSRIIGQQVISFIFFSIYVDS